MSAAMDYPAAWAFVPSLAEGGVADPPEADGRPVLDASRAAATPTSDGRDSGSRSLDVPPSASDGVEDTPFDDWEGVTESPAFIDGPWCDYPDAPPAEGWGFTGTSRKAHYFRDGRSLCRKWGFRSPHAPHEPDTGPSPDDCAACRKALEAERVAAK